MFDHKGLSQFWMARELFMTANQVIPTNPFTKNNLKQWAKYRNFVRNEQKHLKIDRHYIRLLSPSLLAIWGLKLLSFQGNGHKCFKGNFKKSLPAVIFHTPYSTLTEGTLIQEVLYWVLIIFMSYRQIKQQTPKEKFWL